MTKKRENYPACKELNASEKAIMNAWKKFSLSYLQNSISSSTCRKSKETVCLFAAQLFQGLHRFEKYLNLEGLLEKLLNLNLPEKYWKIT